jgi:hypothetical protein
MDGGCGVVWRGCRSATVVSDGRMPGSRAGVMRGDPEALVDSAFDAKATVIIMGGCIDTFGALGSITVIIMGPWGRGT